MGALLIQAKNLGLIKGFEAGLNEEVITHLQFVDDNILFCCSSTRVEVILLKIILRCFQLVLNLNVNWSKSSLVGVSCLEEAVRLLAGYVHFKIRKLPFAYLGFLVGTRAKSTVVWNPMIERVEKRLSTWQRRYLSL